MISSNETVIPHHSRDNKAIDYINRNIVSAFSFTLKYTYFSSSVIVRVKCESDYIKRAHDLPIAETTKSLTISIQPLSRLFFCLDIYLYPY